MNRLNELKKYYYQCEKAKILEKHSAISSGLNEKLSRSGTVTFTLDERVEQDPIDELRQMLKSWLDYSLEVYHSEVYFNFV